MRLLTFPAVIFAAGLALLSIVVLAGEPEQAQKFEAPVLQVEMHSGDRVRTMTVSYSGALPDSIALTLVGQRRVYLGRPDTAAVAP